MSFYYFSSLLNALTATFIGFFVYFNNRKSKTNQLFVLFCMGVAMWAYPYCFWPGAQDKATALLSFQLLHVGAIFLPIFYLHFILVWLNLYQEKKRVLKLGYLAGLILTPFVFTPLFIKDMVPKLSFKYWAEPGILYHFFLLIFFSYAIYSVYLLIKALTTADETKQNQIKYVLIGTIVGYLGGATNYPLWYNIPIPPLGNWTTTVYVAIVAYAIIKHHLMDIRVVLTEFFVSLIALLLLIEAVTAQTLTAGLYRIGLFTAFCVFGYLLIKSVLNEIKLREKLEIANNAKSEFVSIASHQLRTPLTAIKGYISMMIENTYGKLPEALLKPLQNVYESNEKLIKLVNDLLDLSRLEAGKIEFTPTLTSLEKIVADIIEELKINADKKSLYLKLIKPKEALPEIMVDQPKIRQVVLNLIDNAIKYTREGGITIKLKATDSQEQIIISDTGIGISPDEIPSLFQMFSRASAGAKLHTEGSGVGLHVAKKFIEMHQGRIWVESEGKNEGSTFYIELPIKLK